MNPLKNIPSKIPVAPMFATRVSRFFIFPNLRISAPRSIPITHPT